MPYGFRECLRNSPTSSLEGWLHSLLVMTQRASTDAQSFRDYLRGCDCLSRHVDLTRIESNDDLLRRMLFAVQHELSLRHACKADSTPSPDAASGD